MLHTHHQARRLSNKRPRRLGFEGGEEEEEEEVGAGAPDEACKRGTGYLKRFEIGFHTVGFIPTGGRPKRAECDRQLDISLLGRSDGENQAQMEYIRRADAHEASNTPRERFPL